jgi:aerobic-type carbon monoxide dehydrogenase small subunit (CoxS/CutS family)
MPLDDQPLDDEHLDVRVGVDGRTRTMTVRSDETLLETLRERCDRTSVRYGCGIGVCGTCTVLVEGDAQSSCLLLTAMVDGREVTTPEGSAEEGLTTAQQAFVDASAFQCSYCIPGMALAAQAAWERDPGITVDELCDELAGNLCRCGSYPQIRAALERLAGESSPAGPVTPEELTS